MTPTPEFQIQFLQGVQRILKEGVFTSTYKFALLHAIADCCIEKGKDDDSELKLNTWELAEKFIDIYWSQTSVFPNGKKTEVLFQNRDKQAGVITYIAQARQTTSTLSTLKTGNQYTTLRNKVARVIQNMPLWKLQTIGSLTFDALYPHTGQGSEIHLKPGVAFCFRKFYGQVIDMLHSAWITWVQRAANNQSILGQNVNLEAFLFDSKRSNLKPFVPALREEQSNKCFYCEKQIRSEPEVDHFIPWSRYSVDLGHNFVLAHKSCNGDKSDFLATNEFYDKWTDRNEQSGEHLSYYFDSNKLLHDLNTSTSVASWAYEQCKMNGNQVWRGYKEGFAFL